MIRTPLALMAALTALAAPALLAQGIEDPRTAFPELMANQDWSGNVERTERGHRIGNPEAEAELIEFLSYTCGHCADFAQQSGPTLDLVGIGPGKISVEVRPAIRNELDLTLSLLAQCGDPSQFKKRHRMLLYSQSDWLAEARRAPQGQKAIWMRGGAAGRLNAARALDLDDLMVANGLTLPQVNACLQDEAAAETIRANARADREDFAIEGTPTLALDGEKLENVHSWPALAQVLLDRFRPDANGSLPRSSP